MPELCNACGGELTELYPRVLDPVTGEPFSVQKCVRCGLGHTVPRPEDLGRYYGPRYYGGRHSFTSRYCTRRRLGIVASVVEAEGGSRLLDVGCGDGSFLLGARDSGWSVAGTEASPELARRAGLDVRQNIDQVGDLAPFDCVTMWHSLEHMRDVKSTLSKLASMLKPDGRLIAAVPDVGGLQAAVFGRNWFHLDVPRHLYHFDAGSLRYCLESAGLAVVRQWHQELEYDLFGWSQSALNCIFSAPNLFFDRLRGKPRKSYPLTDLSSFILGSILTGLALPAVAVGTLAGRGGTLIAAAGPAA